MVYNKTTKKVIKPTKEQIRENLILEKRKELAKIQSMIELVKYYIRLKEQEEIEKKEPRPFKFIINLDEDDDSIGPSISLTQLYPSKKLPVTSNKTQKSWADIDEEDDGKFFETYRPVFD